MTRRELLQWFGYVSAATLFMPLSMTRAATESSKNSKLITRAVPPRGPVLDALPVIGLGSWITFNVGDDAGGRANALEVMRAFFAAGGRLIDSSPMYGSAQAVIGAALAQLGSPKTLFGADKVWTSGDGPKQIERSRTLWGVPRFDLLQVHNLTDWERKLPLLLEMRAAGRVRFVGITTSEGRRHAEMERVKRAYPIDFVQLTYNIRDREAEQRLLPLAAERGIAVIANRPFQQGALIDWAKRHPLPSWSQEIDCANWAQFLLKFIVSHPALTCAIPATSKVSHLHENMGAASGRLPDAAFRQRMVSYIEGL